jgi:hypothetical protein
MWDYLTPTTWANNYSWRMRNSQLITEQIVISSYWSYSRRALDNICTLPGPKELHNVFVQIFIQNVLYTGILLLSLGMLSKKQWALRPFHAALRLFPRWHGGWPAAAQAAWSRNAMPRRPSSAEGLVINFWGKFPGRSFFPPTWNSAWHSQHGERPKLTIQIADFQM